MTDEELRAAAHDVDVTVWVGKSGIDAVVEELRDQLDDGGPVKVKFLRSARGDTTAETLAADLAERVHAEAFEARGHTAVYRA